MQDLTKITTPFGLLDAETQQAMAEHGGPYEWFNGEVWMENPFIPRPLMGAMYAYRVKPTPLTKPSVDWSVFEPQFKWLAQDQDGEAWVFNDPPIIEGWGWVFDGEQCRRIDGFLASYTPGTCDWRDSLIQRPEGV